MFFHGQVQPVPAALPPALPPPALPPPHHMCVERVAQPTHAATALLPPALTRVSVACTATTRSSAATLLFTRSASAESAATRASSSVVALRGLSEGVGGQQEACRRVVPQKKQSTKLQQLSGGADGEHMRLGGGAGEERLPNGGCKWAQH